MEAVLMFLAVACGAILAIFLFLWLTFRSLRRKRLMQDLPTVKTTGVFIGLVEVKGTAECDRPLIGHLSEKPCVWQSWSIQEHYSRTVTESYTDAKGKRQTRTRTESGWKTLASDKQSTVFFLQDDEGCVRVNPSGAEIHGVSTFSHHCRRGDPLYHAKGDWGPVADSTHRRMFVENAIPLHQNLYVVGRSRLRNDAVAAEIAYDKQSPMFLISTREEIQHHSRENLIFTILSVIYFLAAAALGISAGIGTAQGPEFSNEIWLVVCAILAGVGAFLVPAAIWGAFWLWTVYNSLVGMKNRVKQAWSNIDVELKRRFELIESLVNTIKGFREHERETQETLAFLRTQINAIAADGFSPELAACTPHLSILAENYPEIKADELFRNLHDNLVETELRIALARGYYNEMVSYHNTRRERVPECYVAALAKLAPQPFFHAESFEKQAVSVENLSDI